MTRRSRYPQEVRERAVRMVFDHQDEHHSQWKHLLTCGRRGRSNELGRCLGPRNVASRRNRHSRVSMLRTRARLRNVKGRWDAFGRAMLDHLNGKQAKEVVEREGASSTLVLGRSLYFSEYRKWRSHERQAMRYVRDVLLMGDGTGRLGLSNSGRTRWQHGGR
jgi:transposase-like protein